MKIVDDIIVFAPTKEILYKCLQQKHHLVIEAWFGPNAISGIEVLA